MSAVRSWKKNQEQQKTREQERLYAGDEEQKYKKIATTDIVGKGQERKIRIKGLLAPAKTP